MSRHFTIPTMLRMTPNELLKQFFDRLGHRLLALDWRKLGERQVEPILTTMSWLSREAQEQIESSLASIFELSCETGWQNILHVARERGENKLAQEVPRDSCVYARAMWVWIHKPEVFEQALMVHEVEALPRCRRRTGLPLLTPRITSATKHELGVAFSTCLRREEGRGQNCSVEHFQRRDGADVFVAYTDDFVRTVMAHDEQGRLIPRSFQQTFEIVFAYHAAKGMLEHFATVAPLVKPKLEALFGQIILGADLAEQAYRRPFDLNRLKDRYFCLETDPLDHVKVSIPKLRFDVPDGPRVTVEPKENIYDEIDTCFSDKVTLEDVTISQATLLFHFLPYPGRRPGKLRCEMTHPDHCNIRSWRPDRREIGCKYLRRWRIADV
jgi:hypothetical protein